MTKIDEKTALLDEESIISHNLYKLNEDYINLLNLPYIQTAIKINKIKELIKKKNYKEIWHIIKGRLFWKYLVSKKIGDKITQEKCQNKNFSIKNYSNLKIAVYTCITGNYDNLKEPLFVNDKIDYLVFTDTMFPSTSAWQKIDINCFEDLYNLNNAEKNRFIKMHPHKYLSDYDYSIYVDGSVLIVADMLPLIFQLGDCLIGLHKHNTRDCVYMEAKGVIYSKRAPKDVVRKQMERYRKEGFPINWGLYENTVIVRKHNHPYIVNLMNSWWQEYRITGTKRDQLCFPYVMWKTGFDKDKICVLGNNIDLNPRFRRYGQHRTVF